MHVDPPQPATKGPAAMFTGDVWFEVRAAVPAPSRIRVNAVHFSPGAHTAWHSHEHGQTLHVTEGVGLVQSRGGDVVVIRPGDTVYTPPGEEHWHGADPDHFMTHLAIWDAALQGEDPETVWGEQLTDAEYRVGDAGSPS